MSLKKSDKIIAIIGVIVLIGAAIGIYLYAITEEEPEESKEDAEEMKTFNVIYEEKSMPINPENTDFKIRPKILGKATWASELKLSHENLKNFSITVDYTDNKKGILLGLLFKSVGADTLLITVYDSQDREVVSESIKGDGKNSLISIDVDIANPFSLDPIEATDILDAYDILEEKYVNYDETYTIEMKLKTGLWGKIREILGKDSFTLDVTYTFYDYDLEEPEKETGGDDFDNQESGQDDNGYNNYGPYSGLFLPGKN